MMKAVSIVRNSVSVDDVNNCAKRREKREREIARLRLKFPTWTYVIGGHEDDEHAVPSETLAVRK